MQLSDNKDALLFARIQKGDQSAFQELFELHYASICRVIVQFVKELSTAEDIAQEVFLKFWSKRDSIQLKSYLWPYLRRMAINEALEYIRKQGRLEVIEVEKEEIERWADEENQNEEDEIAIRKAKLQKAIAQLPYKCQLVFTLSRFEGLSYKEISAQLDISTKTVENQISRALKLLRGWLKNTFQSFLYLFF